MMWVRILLGKNRVVHGGSRKPLQLFPSGYEYSLDGRSYNNNKPVTILY